ncbi:MAG: helix-turn-helix domain-containing protein [Tepidiformaceae bacterium]
MVTTRDLAEERLTVAQAAVRLGVSRSSVYRYVREGLLPASRGESGLVFSGLDVYMVQGHRSLGRGGGRIYSDEEFAQMLADDAIEFPPELQHLVPA